ncbi:hypothetical protein FEM48_Zijuj01G0067900 [Ziziphus jujuba var. spinosa]|nr:hypothetical protein FEM48_Zijuj01G0067900 [Ziziphus jujuba var. spinosa]
MNMMYNINHAPAIHSAGVNCLPLQTIQGHQKTAVPVDCPQTKKSSKGASRLAESLSHLLHLHIDTPPRNHNNEHAQIINWNSLTEEKHSTPTKSPKEIISHKWHELHGSKGWENLLDPLHPCLRREIVKYGEFAQATYDAFDYDSFSEYCGSCRFNKSKLFEKLGLSNNGYQVTKYIYAMSHIEIPSWLERSHLVHDSWSKHSNWMGFVCVSDDHETRRIGRRDIVVSWRGTVSPSEWYEDMQRKLEPIGSSAEAKVEHGFQSIYTSKSPSTRYNKSSASEQVMKEVTRLVQFYKDKGEEVSLTITGHSLGGALALLNAYEAAATLPGLPISVISFGAPRVGNIAFRDELHQMGVRTLRVAVKQDIVHRMPGLFFNESLQKFDDITGTLEWVYTHVGAELKLDVRSSPYLKGSLNLTGFHSLETYLHLVDGFLSTSTGFRSNARRDIALVNKACDMLVDELRIPHCWYQLSNKGLVCNEHGRWVKPKRDPEDIPSPTAHDHHIHHSLHLIDQLDDNNSQLQPSYVF